MNMAAKSGMSRQGAWRMHFFDIFDWLEIEGKEFSARQKEADLRFVNLDS